VGKDVHERIYGLLVSDYLDTAAFCLYKEGLRDDHVGEIPVGDLAGIALHVAAAYRDAVTGKEVVYKLFEG